jgi:hypothetical protein
MIGTRSYLSDTRQRQERSDIVKACLRVLGLDIIPASSTYMAGNRRVGVPALTSFALLCTSRG